MLNPVLLLARLKRLEQQCLMARAAKHNISYVLSNDINAIRQELVAALPPEEAEYTQQTTVLLRTSAGDPAYPAPSDIALHLTQQLMDIVQVNLIPDRKKNVMLTLGENPKVFIVHGHDELNLLRLQRLLRQRFDLEPIVLSEQASGGRTIIEKFEAEATDIPFCIVLLTPDDEVVKGQDVTSQARPNVVFELGWFYGKLGRSRVCIICRKGTKIHSDLDGIMRVEFVDNIEETLIDLERELKRAGLGDRL